MSDIASAAASQGLLNCTVLDVSQGGGSSPMHYYYEETGSIEELTSDDDGALDQIYRSVKGGSTRWQKLDRAMLETASEVLGSRFNDPTMLSVHQYVWDGVGFNLVTSL
jgi:hypothetical protein